MIFAKIWYKTHNNEFLAIVKTFKIWHYYLANYKYKIFVFINYNNLYYFIDTKIWVSDKFIGLKHFFDTIFKLIIIKIRQMCL